MTRARLWTFALWVGWVAVILLVTAADVRPALIATTPVWSAEDLQLQPMYVRSDARVWSARNDSVVVSGVSAGDRVWVKAGQERKRGSVPIYVPTLRQASLFGLVSPTALDTVPTVRPRDPLDAMELALFNAFDLHSGHLNFITSLNALERFANHCERKLFGNLDCVSAGPQLKDDLVACEAGVLGAFMYFTVRRYGRDRRVDQTMPCGSLTMTLRGIPPIWWTPG